MMIMISGPYRGGTSDDPGLIRQNLDRLQSYALPVYRRGHVPIIGEWVALPLMKLAGLERVGDAVYDESYPVAHRLLRSCGAVLRIPGDSRGADQDVEVARSLGLPVYFSLDEIPPADA
ncbi:DUF4406 domain-containing protein [Lewinella sp. IMCC34183]|uniref:DUF4406 domain-containing protein n=1 Tax=Lewinella sp. IMCC34183 TaxID=2248762 RepID=UPI000E255315|nr:DUF4406 domain-containing protein [Lewinella sp. IMCC34183]